jgi:hypothetical protein
MAANRRITMPPDRERSDLKAVYRAENANVRVSGLFYDCVTLGTREKRVVYFTPAECRDLQAWFADNLAESSGQPGDQEPFTIDGEVIE